jgi:hypothetical protein
LSVGFAVTLAVLITIRILWTYQQADKSLGRGLFYAGMISLMLITNAISLMNKSKIGYVLVLVAGLMPALGSFALSVHALRLIVVGDWAHDQIGMVTSVIGSLQFVMIVVLTATLLRRSVRDWVWNNAALDVALT